MVNRQRTCRGDSAIVRETVAGVPTNAGAIAVVQPRGGLRPPLLFVRRSPAGGIANFTMHKRTRTRSGTRQPAVRRETRLQRRGRDCSADCLPCVSEHRCSRVAATTGAYAPALDGRCPLYRIRIAPMVRCRNHGGLTPPALVSRAIRPPTELRLLRCTNAHAQERREPAVWRYRACRGTRESHASAASCKVRNGAR